MRSELLRLASAIQGEKPLPNEPSIEPELAALRKQLAEMFPLRATREKLEEENPSLAAEVQDELLGSIARLTAFIQESINLHEFSEALFVADYLCEKTAENFGPEHPTYLESLFIKGQLLTHLERWDEAEATIQFGLSRCKEVLGDASATEAHFREAMGLVYRGRGQLTQACDSFQRAVVILSALDEPHDLLSALVNRGSAERDLGNFREARESLEAALRLQTGLSPSPLELAARMSELGSVLGELGEFASAEQLIRKALEIRLATRPQSRTLIATTLYNLQRTLEHLGRLEEAEQCRKDLDTWLDLDHPHYVSIKNERVVFLLDEGHRDEALEIIRHLRPLAASRHGRNSRVYADTLETWGQYCYQVDRLRAAERAFARAMHIRTQAIGVHHVETLRVSIELGQVYLRRGDLRSAGILLQQTEPLLVEAASPEHLIVAECRTIRGELALSLFQHDEAASHFESALEIRKQAYGEGHLKTALAQNNLATARFGQQRWTEAEGLWQSSLAVVAATRGTTHAYASAIQCNLAILSFNLGRWDEAEAYFVVAEAADRDRGDVSSQNYARLINGWGCLREARGERDLAELTFRRALAVVEDSFGPDHYLAGVIYHNVAACQASKGKATDALDNLLRSEAILARVLGRDHPETLEVSARLQNLRQTPTGVPFKFSPILSLLAVA